MKKTLIEKRKVMLRLLPNAQKQTSLCSFPWYQAPQGSYWYAWPHVDLIEEDESEPTRYFTATVIYVSEEKFDLSSVSDSLLPDCLFEMSEAGKVDVDEAMEALIPGSITQEASLGYKGVEYPIPPTKARSASR